MQIKSTLLSLIFFGVTTSIAGIANAADNHNPCDVACTQQLIAQATASLQTQIQNNLPYLASADWSNICSSGTPAEGCYGDMSSTAFQRFNGISGDWATYASVNVPTTSVPKSVYVKEFYGTSGNTPLAESYFSISLGSSLTTGAKCQMFTQSGAPVQPLYGLFAQTPSTGGYQQEVNMAGIVAISPNTTDYTNLYYAEDPSYPAGAFATNNPVYVVCIGYMVTSSAPYESNAAEFGTVSIV